MPSDGPTIIRPTPRRPFDVSITSATPPNENVTPPVGESTDRTHLDARTFNSGAETPSFSRTKSLLNLTSSTLFGIYSPTGYHEREDASTPWGTGAQTPRERSSIDGSAPGSEIRSHRPIPIRTGSSNYAKKASMASRLFNLALRSILLFVTGMGYGILVTHLHQEQGLAHFQVEGFIRPNYSWSYLVFWGLAGVGFGGLLPWVDTKWEERASSRESEKRHSAVEDEEEDSASTKAATDWNPAVRSIGAFVGIAFAIRKLSWTSTLQASLTLALVNPVLWYLIDRSKTGFMLSAAVGLVGTTILLNLNPEMMPFPGAPSYTPSANSTSAVPNQPGGYFISQETIECGIWIISVLFCSCVCFGNIGRRLALKPDVPMPMKSNRRNSFRDL